MNQFQVQNIRLVESWTPTTMFGKMPKSGPAIGHFVKFKLVGEEVNERIWGKVREVDQEKRTIKLELANDPVNDEFKCGQERTIGFDEVMDYLGPEH